MTELSVAPETGGVSHLPQESLRSLTASFDQLGDEANLEGYFELPDGTCGAMSDKWASPPAQSPLNPTQWKDARVLKDRVCEIETAHGTLILKERKTAEHHHGQVDGDGEFITGMPSKDEYELARTLQEKGTVRQGEVQAAWEAPVGYIEMPNGYQFVVFEKSTGQPIDEASHVAAEGILDNFETYLSEYEEVAREARRGMLAGAVMLVRGVRPTDSGSQLTREQFAHAKARSLCRIGSALSYARQKELGYRDEDASDEFLYEVTIGDDKRVNVRAVRYDLEYYTSMPPTSEPLPLPRTTDYPASDIEAGAYRYLIEQARSISN